MNTMEIKVGYKYRWPASQLWFTITKIENGIAYYLYEDNGPSLYKYPTNNLKFPIPHPDNKILEFNELIDNYYGL